MSINPNENENALPEYLKSLIKLNELQKMTDELDEELADSQRLMNDMKRLFDSLPADQNSLPISYEQLAATQFLDAVPRQLLLDDMPASSADVDIEDIVATMKLYTEGLRKKLDLSRPLCKVTQRTLYELDLGKYASSLDHLVKRLSTMNINKHDDGSKNAELEAKVQQLCNDGNAFTQMIESLKNQGEATNAAQAVCRDPLAYDNLVNKLLADINEVTCVLNNQN